MSESGEGGMDGRRQERAAWKTRWVTVLIGGEGSCGVSEVRCLLELEGGIHYASEQQVVEHAWVKKTAKISWGFHISERGHV